MTLRFPLLALGALAASLAFAATPVGNWTGKIIVNPPPMPANMPPAQKAMIAKSIAQIRNGKLLLTMKANKTYTVKTIGLPIGGNKEEGGTWTQAGNVVSLKEGRPGGRTQSFNLSKDGKKMTFSLPQKQGQVVFSR